MLHNMQKILALFPTRRRYCSHLVVGKINVMEISFSVRSAKWGHQYIIIIIIIIIIMDDVPYLMLAERSKTT